jgi:hypothetical protein
MTTHLGHALAREQADDELRHLVVEAGAELDKGVANGAVLADVTDEGLGVLDAHAEGGASADEAADDVLHVLHRKAAEATTGAGGRVEHDDTPALRVSTAHEASGRRRTRPCQSRRA